MSVFTWWNVGNLFDDHDDPDTGDMVRSNHAYRRDLSEIAEILGMVNPASDLIGLAEVENRAVMDELVQELRWHQRHLDYICPAHIDSKDPRGIDVGVLVRRDGAVRVDRVEAHWPLDSDAVRPAILVHARLAGTRLRVALLHSKSKRSGPCQRNDPTPGSRIRFAYGRLLRQLAIDAHTDGVPLLVMGDFNDEPHNVALRDGAGAHIGRAAKLNGNRLYNLTLEAAPDSPGTHNYRGDWSYLDQVLISGSLLAPTSSLHVVKRPRI
ncbi:MAG: endonuclease/exonuclease/phosphatase family protein, partial [Planctomycetota bacterium]|nr:endonuclease/exonuclease/phosphatase family protein [Planctomycetota bacterium]